MSIVAELSKNAKWQIRKVEKKVYDFNGIHDSIESARNSGLQKIKLRFWDVTIKPSQYADKLYVYSTNIKEEGRYGYGPKYYGWITRTGTNIADEEVIEILQDIAEDPKKSAKLYGMQTKRCSCCGLKLTNAESIRLGIGPICLDKYGW